MNLERHFRCRRLLLGEQRVRVVSVVDDVRTLASAYMAVLYRLTCSIVALCINLADMRKSTSQMGLSVRS